MKAKKHISFLPKPQNDIQLQCQLRSFTLTSVHIMNGSIWRLSLDTSTPCYFLIWMRFIINRRLCTQSIFPAPFLCQFVSRQRTSAFLFSPCTNLYFLEQRNQSFSFIIKLDPIVFSD